jgi:hypothetical protein
MPASTIGNTHARRIVFAQIILHPPLLMDSHSLACCGALHSHNAVKSNNIALPAYQESARGQAFRGTYQSVPASDPADAVRPAIVTGRFKNGAEAVAGRAGMHPPRLAMKRIG